MSPRPGRYAAEKFCYASRGDEGDAVKPQSFAEADCAPARKPGLFARLRKRFWSILTRGSELSSGDTIW